MILGVIGVIRVAFWAMVGRAILSSPTVRRTTGTGCLDRGHRAGRRGALGIALRFDAAISFAPVGADPATSSAPFVATLVDVTGLIIYFSIALLIMRGAMLLTRNHMFSRSADFWTRRKVFRSAGSERAAGRQQRARSGRPSGQARAQRFTAKPRGFRAQSPQKINRSRRS